jgi:enterochelin esterase-like enzyme
MHDGQMLFDDELIGIKQESKNKQEWKVDETFSELIKTKKIKDCIVVGIWYNGKFRGSEYIPEKFLPYMEDSFKKTFIKEVLENKPQSDNYLKFIVQELKPHIDSTFSTEKR